MTVRLHPHPLRSDIGDELCRGRGGVAGRRLRDNVTGEAYLNFLDGHGTTPGRVRAVYTSSDWDRLVHLKARIDPTNLFSFNRAIPTG